MTFNTATAACQYEITVREARENLLNHNNVAMVFSARVIFLTSSPVIGIFPSGNMEEMP